VKLVAFGAVGLFVTFGIYGGIGDVFSRAMAEPQLAKLTAVAADNRSYATWFSLTLLAGLAILFLPRQFQVTVVENVSEAHLKRAIWLFPLYLFLINLFVLPIALGGLMQFAGQRIDADTFVLTLPMSAGQELLALLVFVGGLSAATGMVIVETIALSTMVCNDLVMPLLLRTRALALQAERDLSGLLLGIRRGAIVVILMLGYLYFRLAGDAYALVGIGLISFSAVAQFAPAMIGGMYWRGGTRDGALAGLSAGFAVWAYTLLLPSFAKSGWLPASFIAEGPFGIELLKPHQLFGLTGLDDISHCLFWAFGANITTYIIVSLLRSPTAAEASQATQFVDALKTTRPVGSALWRGSADAAELIALVGRFLGPQRAQAAFAAYARRHGVDDITRLEADADLVHHAESLLTGAIGSASARAMVASVAKEEPLSLAEVMNILDEASQLRTYSRELERKSRQLEAATTELKEANERLLELDRLKDDFMASVSHELRTPLTSIRAFSEILRDDPKAPLPDRERFLGIIVSETERLTRLVNQILDMAKIESGNVEWRVEDVDLKAVVEQSAAATSQLFLEKGAVLTLVLPPAVPPVRADRDRLMQVVINLLSNAVKFVPRDAGRVTISLAQQADGICVRVVDNGPGIRREDQEVIFERFRQGGDSLTGKPTGTGLGLPISRKIVEYFGGRLWVESEPGQGAAFLFVLPAA
ncbi:MAG TPA: ATP-binding protein, partial [Azospira sp.]|nr:ATP-binding protein [Azospira sp.]